MFDSWTILAMGLLSGFVFGFLLHKGGVTKYETIVNQFRLKDFTVLKIMLTAIVVGGVGVYFLHEQGLAKLSIKPALIVANVVGGAIFGVGMVLLGLCPGTAVAALGEGNRRALAAIFGMLAGAWLQAESYGFMAEAVRCVDLGAATWPSVLSVSPWLLLAALALLAGAVFVALEFWERRASARVPGDDLRRPQGTSVREPAMTA
jgi:uncharacterized membrane protein YedE/YeeE